MNSVYVGFYELKKLIDTTYGNELRDIEPTPSILNDGRAARPNMTLRVRTALSIIMSRTFNKPVDANGLEVKGAMLGITKLANQLAGPIRLTLVAQNAYPNIESAKKGSWASVRPQIKKNYSLMLESQVLNLYYLPISRCQNMWLANYYLCKAFNLKR
ncbi:hypothetical protein BDF21DRAFT_410202 [Thamnidium elegans]|nr:hypothetical protein BDF21DRAFT_410202 [Thamnidium elegans]